MTTVSTPASTPAATTAATPEPAPDVAEGLPARPPAALLMIGDMPAGDVILRSYKLAADSLYLHGENPPTPNQVSAVLHAMANHFLLAHMNSEPVLALGDDKAHLGPTWRQDIAHGRFLQMLGDSIAEWHDPREQEQAKARAAELADRARTAVTNYRENDGIDQRDTDAMADFIEHVLARP